MTTRHEIEKQIDFTVDHEVVLNDFFSSQRKVIEAVVSSDMDSGGIQFGFDSIESTNRMTFLYVIEKLNLMNAVRYALENFTDLSPTIEDLLFQVSSKILMLTASKFPGNLYVSTQSIIHEIVCDELAKELGPEYKELVEMAREGESLC